jgi:membrane fusion protein (multidrug efflux system)
VAPAAAPAAAFVGGAARAAVPTGLAESTVVYAATAGAVPASVAVLTEGVLKSMFLRKVRLVLTAVAVVAALAAGAVALAQSGIGRPKDGAGKTQDASSTGWTYHILASRNGEPPRKVAVVEMTGDQPIRVDVPGALILFQPKRDGEQGHRQIVLTGPRAMDVDITQRYIGRIRSQRHIDVRTLETGYVSEIAIKEGQSVKGPRDGRPGDLLFRIAPILNQAKPVADSTNVRAPFDGIVGRLQEQLGSLVKEGDILTTLSDNGVMWVYFNVPEKQYLEDRANLKEVRERRIELMLANRTKFPHPGQIGAIAADFDKENGNIAYRADFPNPDGLLRHGQSGTIAIHRKVHDAIVIPQRATFEMMDKRYVWVVGDDDKAHQTLITVEHELEDIFVINGGLKVGDRIVLEGIRQVRDGEKVGYEFRPPEEVMRKPRNHPE